VHFLICIKIPFYNDQLRPSNLLLLPTALVLCLFSIVACSSVTEPPPSTRNVPVYPDALELTRSSVSEGTNFITFKTPDSPEDVYAFYEETLSKDGWARPIDQYQPDIGVAYEWRQASINGPTHLAYKLEIVATKTTTSMTDVEIVIMSFDPLK
jgi:hypothetical protein